MKLLQQMIEFMKLGKKLNYWNIKELLLKTATQLFEKEKQE